MPNSLGQHELQHATPPCPSPTPGVHSDSRPSSPWCHLGISSSVVPFSSCPPIPPSIRVFSNESTLCMRWPKYWVSAVASFLPKKSQGWCLIGKENYRFHMRAIPRYEELMQRRNSLFFFSLEKNSLKEHCESVFYVLRADLGLACRTVRAVWNGMAFIVRQRATVPERKQVKVCLDNHLLDLLSDRSLKGRGRLGLWS